MAFNERPHVDDETLSRYRRGTLDAGARARVAAHLGRCASCSRRFGEVTGTGCVGSEGAGRIGVVRDDDHVVEVEHGEEEVVIRSSVDED